MNLFELAAKISLDSNEFDQGIDEAAAKGKKLSHVLGNGLKKSAEIGLKAVTLAATGISTLVGFSVNAYADYEQLVGGAQLMFGDAYDFVADKAANAYSTVQMSQNEYLQQVNGFATGLKTALGGNEQAAAELADRIVTAEADVVAATGNAAENVQNAFNGIMKSNYTMLDNLQLGITPTKAGFQELIDTVNEWNKENGKATDYQIDNLADAQSALLDYIEMQGLSGYASMEASKTISGSIAMTKSAWKNLLIGMSDDNADISALFDDLVDSAGIAAENLEPRIDQALRSMGDLIDDAVPVLIDKIPEFLEEKGPDLFNAGIGLIGKILEGVYENSGQIGEAIETLSLDLANAVFEYGPEFVVQGIIIFGHILSGVAEALPEIADQIPELVENLKSAVEEHKDELVEIGSRIADGVIQGLDKLSGYVFHLQGIDFLDQSKSLGELTGWAPAPKANGIDSVPYDGYLSLLHEGEMVLTRNEAEEYRTGGGRSGGVTIIQNIYGSSESPIEHEAAARALFETARWTS